MAEKESEKIIAVENLDDMMRLVGEELASFANSDVVVGSPIEFSTATVVPVSRVSVALAGGGAGGQGQGRVKSASKKTTQGEGAGGASTGVAKVRPVAVVVFTANKVEVLPIPEKFSRGGDKLIELLPDLVSRVSKALTLRRSAAAQEE